MAQPNDNLPASLPYFSGLAPGAAALGSSTAAQLDMSTPPAAGVSIPQMPQMPQMPGVPPQYSRSSSPALGLPSKVPTFRPPSTFSAVPPIPGSYTGSSDSGTPPRPGSYPAPVPVVPPPTSGNPLFQQNSFTSPFSMPPAPSAFSGQSFGTAQAAAPAGLTSTPPPGQSAPPGQPTSSPPMTSPFVPTGIRSGSFSKPAPTYLDNFAPPAGSTTQESSTARLDLQRLASTPPHGAPQPPSQYTISPELLRTVSMPAQPRVPVYPPAGTAHHDSPGGPFSPAGTAAFSYSALAGRRDPPRRTDSKLSNVPSNAWVPPTPTSAPSHDAVPTSNYDSMSVGTPPYGSAQGGTAATAGAAGTASTGVPEANVLFSAYSVPNQRDVANKSLLPLGFIFTPLFPLDPTPPLLRRPAIRCDKRECRAVLNLYCNVWEPGKWKCSLCGSWNTNSDQVDTYQSCPEVVLSTVEYVEPDHQVLMSVGSMAAPPAGTAGGMADEVSYTHIFVIDASTPTEDLSTLKESILTTLKQMPQSCRIGLIAFSHVVCVYDLNSTHVASAHVLPGTASPTPEDLAPLTEGEGIYTAPIHACLETVQMIFDALTSSTGEQESDPQRCFGAAVETAISLIQATDGSLDAKLDKTLISPPGGRVAVCMSGPANFGPGAVISTEETQHEGNPDLRAMEYYQDVAFQAAQAQVSVDVYANCVRGIKARVMQALVMATGGHLIQLKGFGHHFQQNLALSFTLTCGRDAWFDVRVPPTVSISRIIGPTAPQLEANDKSSKDSANIVRMASCQRRFNYAVLFDLLDDIPDDYIHFQFIARYTNALNQRILRVTTRRIATTGSAPSFIKSIDVDVVSILLAKVFVAKARRPESDPRQVIQQLDEHLRDIAVEYGVPDKFVRNGKQMYLYPQDIEQLAGRLFHLRRGHLLGPILQHPDDIDCVRVLFIMSSFPDALRILLPTLRAAFRNPSTSTTAPPGTANPGASIPTPDGSASLQRVTSGVQVMHLSDPRASTTTVAAPPNSQIVEVPLETLALNSDWVLLMDLFTDLYVWSGANVAGRTELDDLRVALLTLSGSLISGRFPAPETHIFKEGSSMARLLFSRLNPSHKDAPSEQDQDMPLLSTLSREQRAALTSKFHRTDDVSFRQYYRNLFK